MTKQKESLYAWLIVLMALVLRLFQLGKESLWIDEGFSLRDASNLEILQSIRPVYFLLLRGWLWLGGGANEATMRLPSVLFGVAGVWVLYLLGRRLLGAPAALLASAFMAISVLHINHSQEVRMYSLTVLMSLLASYSLILYLEGGKTRHAAAYGFTAILSMLTFPLTVLIFMAHGLFLLLYVKAYRPRTYFILGAELLVVAVSAPWLLNAARAAPGYSQGLTATLDRPTPMGVISFLGRFFLWKWYEPHGLAAVGIVGFSLVVTGVMLLGLKGLQRKDAGLMFIVLWLAIPFAVLIVASYALTNMWMVHYLIAASPAFYLLVAKGILSLRNRYLMAGTASIIVILTLGRLGMYYVKTERPEWRQAVTYIQAHEQRGDAIGVYYGACQYVFDYYYHGTSPWCPVGTDEYEAEDFRPWSEAKVKRLFQDYPLRGRRFWLVLSHHTMRGGFSIINSFKARYPVLDHKSYHLVEFYLFDGGADGCPRRVRK
ncbi:MAG TPA: glycosyltransferase family 39 protein [Armatimonadota bacterium]|nr:glycosyltransferase family 39 protein [Armatimonadota bacterium]